ncbi:MAG: carboxypeptidase-like regulatory domain-containing protein [Promethearchaeota archaeon]
MLFPTFLTNFSYLEKGSEIISEDDGKSDDLIYFNNLKINDLGNDTWWDYSFRYRSLIAVENPYACNFTDYAVSVTFNYKQMIQNNQIYQNDLDDLRVVENGILRKFYVAKDYPEIDFATIYFDTNITQYATEVDTYLYYGNDTVGSVEARDPSESFGWIKNGDFELDIGTGEKYDPFGWNFTHEPIDVLGIVSGDDNPYPTASNQSTESYNAFENRPVHILECDYDHDIDPDWDFARRVEHGDYAYVWGSNALTLNPAGGDVYDYAGTFYSHPFKVPEVEGGNIVLQVYRNVRTMHFERRKKQNDPIDFDGYFMRLCNATSYGSDVDSHIVLGSGTGEYIEALGGYAVWSPSGKFWSDSSFVQNHTKENNYDTHSDSSDDGEITGMLYYDITAYAGQEIFLEAGAWGEEEGPLGIGNEGRKSAFFQFDYIQFNYELPASLDEVQAHNSTITIVARDVDGRLVPNAEVMIVNNSVAKGMPGYQIANGLTNSNGRITFELIPNGRYNITANYTLGSREIEVFNSFNSGIGPYYFNGIFYTQEINLDLWTIDFEISDWDRIPLSIGYIEINESLGGDLLETLILDENGKATFRWENTADYYFRVFYNDPDYIGGPFLLNESYIYRSNYDKVGIKYREHALWVNSTNTFPIDSTKYSIDENIYTNGSRTEFGNNKITKVNITLSNMIDQLTNISIYYIDKDNTTGTENLMYFKEYNPGIDNDFIELDIPYINNAKLESENFEVYGLQVVVNGLNFSGQCNGIVKVEFIETCNIFNRTNLAQLNIRVIRKEGGVEVDYPALVKVLDNKTGQPLINLTSIDGNAYSPTNGLPFWYLKDRVYNISINSLNQTNVDFNVTYMSPINQWSPSDVDGINWYNYTLYGGSSITFNLIFKVEVNLTNYITAFFNATGTEEVLWGENISFSLVFYISSDNGQTWNPITNPSASCTLSIREVGSSTPSIRKNMDHIVSGNFSKTINSSLLSAGGSALFYSVNVEGIYPGYPDPAPYNFLLKVNAIPTEISTHNYNSLLEIPDQSYSAYYGEVLNITIRYAINGSGDPLGDASLTYSWIGLSPISISVDPINTEYYTFTLDTTDALTTGLKIISITASLENYTSQTNFLVYLTIRERITMLNGQTELVYLSPKIWVQDAHYFTFTYTDANTSVVLGDLSIATYSWYELDEFGNRIPGSQGTGSLIQYLNNSYYLDFNTEIRSVGYYFLHIALQKENYEACFAYLNLEIMLREFDVSITGFGSNNQIKVDQGDQVEFEVNLIDLSRGNIDLEGAKVTLNIRGANFSLSETVPGVYTGVFSTSSVDTFFTSKTFVGKIIIEADNFTSQEVSITVVVNMEEIFPGMPTFYFILITASVIGVVGSLVTYRVIQQARIPKHVKKIRKIKGYIKSSKKITESFSIPTKEEMVAKLFGDDWRNLGLSLEEALGIQELKAKKSLIKEKIPKEGGDKT